MHKVKYILIGVVYLVLGLMYTIKSLKELKTIYSDESDSMGIKIMNITINGIITICAYLIAIFYLTEFWSKNI